MESGFRSSFPKKSDEISLGKKKYKVATDGWEVETWRHTSGTWSMVAIAAEIGLNLARIA